MATAEPPIHETPLQGGRRTPRTAAGGSEDPVHPLAVVVPPLVGLPGDGGPSPLNTPWTGSGHDAPAARLQAAEALTASLQADNAALQRETQDLRRSLRDSGNATAAMNSAIELAGVKERLKKKESECRELQAACRSHQDTAQRNAEALDVAHAEAIKLQDQLQRVAGEFPVKGSGGGGVVDEGRQRATSVEPTVAPVTAVEEFRKEADAAMAESRSLQDQLNRERALTTELRELLLQHQKQQQEQQQQHHQQMQQMQQKLLQLQLQPQETESMQNRISELDHRHTIDQQEIQDLRRELEKVHDDLRSRPTSSPRNPPPPSAPPPLQAQGFTPPFPSSPISGNNHHPQARGIPPLQPSPSPCWEVTQEEAMGTGPHTPSSHHRISGGEGSPTTDGSHGGIPRDYSPGETRSPSYPRDVDRPAATSWSKHNSLPLPPSAPFPLPEDDLTGRPPPPHYPVSPLEPPDQPHEPPFRPRSPPGSERPPISSYESFTPPHDTSSIPRRPDERTIDPSSSVPCTSGPGWVQPPKWSRPAPSWSPTSPISTIGPSSESTRRPSDPPSVEPGPANPPSVPIHPPWAKSPNRNPSWWPTPPSPSVGMDRPATMANGTWGSTDGGTPGTPRARSPAPVSGPRGGDNNRPDAIRVLQQHVDRLHADVVLRDSVLAQLHAERTELQRGGRDTEVGPLLQANESAMASQQQGAARLHYRIQMLKTAYDGVMAQNAHVATPELFRLQQSLDRLLGYCTSLVPSGHSPPPPAPPPASSWRPPSEHGSTPPSPSSRMRPPPPGGMVTPPPRASVPTPLSRHSSPARIPSARFPATQHYTNLPHHHSSPGLSPSPGKPLRVVQEAVHGLRPAVSVEPLVRGSTSPGSERARATRSPTSHPYGSPTPSASAIGRVFNS